MVSDIVQTFYRYLPVAKLDRQWGLFVTTVGESHLGPAAPWSTKVIVVGGKPARS